MILEFLSDIGNILLLLVVFIILYVVLRDRQITYYIQDSDTNIEFKRETSEILKNSAINNRYKISEVNSKNEADIIVELRSRSSLNEYHKKPEYYPGTNKQIRFSLTWQQPKPYVAIDDNNWTYGVPESGLSIPEYRKYVIQHEFMHALGFDHQPCNADTAINGRCPVLYQATRGPPPGFLAGYEVIPLDYTKKLDNSYF
jgi:hypothetical protein